jgi:transposase
LVHQNKRTVHEWLWKFHKNGITAKDSKKQTGRPCELDHKQRKELIVQLEKGPPHSPNGLWTSKEVRNFIHKKYGVLYGPTNIWNILTKAGFSVQRPRKKHHKSASIEEIKRFKKTPVQRRATTERKGLLWQLKTKQHLA